MLNNRSGYRGALAGNIHQSLIGYLRAPSPVNLAALDDALKGADQEALLEPSINGDSHLVDILHLTIAINGDSEQSHEIIQVLFDKLMRRCDAFPIAKSALLIQENAAGFTPLHQALKSGNPANMNAYFDEVRRAREARLISDDDYKNLLIRPNAAGFTPLHQAANSGSFLGMRFFVGELEAFLDFDELNTVFNVRARGHLPSCQLGKSDACLINPFLEQCRDEYARLASSHVGRAAPSLKRAQRAPGRSDTDSAAEPDFRRQRRDHATSQYRAASAFGDYRSQTSFQAPGYY